MSFFKIIDIKQDPQVFYAYANAILTPPDMIARSPRAPESDPTVKLVLVSLRGWQLQDIDDWIIMLAIFVNVN